MVKPGCCYRQAMKVRPREAADLPAARAFLVRHNNARVARLGELLKPLDHPALPTEDLPTARPRAGCLR